MIALDTSAIMALALDEPEADRISEALTDAAGLCISAATLAETLIVARRRGVGDVVATLIDDLGVDVEPLTKAGAYAAAAAYDRYGKGVDPAGLNWGDCFAYALARAKGCPLLFVGDDFARTDVGSAQAIPRDPGAV